MSLESRPQLRYARIDNDPASESVHAHAHSSSGADPSADTMVKALELARQLEELLEDTRSVALVGQGPRGVDEARSHSTRMARAMAASLVDELAAIVRPAPKSGVA